jgi:hypothetical protein
MRVKETALETAPPRLFRFKQFLLKGNFPPLHWIVSELLLYPKEMNRDESRRITHQSPPSPK